jgi:hypothetical protein
MAGCGAQSALRPDRAAALALQRAAGNRATRRRLRAPPTKDPPKTGPIPRLPQKVIVGSTPLSREAEGHRIANPNMPAGTNLVVVEYTVGDSGRVQRQVIENRRGVAHSEAEMDQFFLELRRQVRAPVNVHEIYSERQPCGPSDHDCEGMLLRRYPAARTTFGWNYQEAVAGGPETRAAQSRQQIEAHHRRITATGQLEWVFEASAPAHHERNEPGGISRAPRRGGWSRLAGLGRMLGRVPGGHDSVGDVGDLAMFLVDRAAERFVFGPKAREALEARKPEFQAEIERQLAPRDLQTIALQSSGDVAYARVTMRVYHSRMHGTGAHFISDAEVNHVAVSSKFEEGVEWDELGATERVLRQAGGLTTVLATSSHPLTLHPKVVTAAMQKLAAKMDGIEHQLETGDLDAKARDALIAENRGLVECLEQLAINGKKASSFADLGKACAAKLTPSVK